MHDVYAAKLLFLATCRTVDSVAEPGGLELLPDEIRVADTAPRPQPWTCSRSSYFEDNDFPLFVLHRVDRPVVPDAQMPFILATIRMAWSSWLLSRQQIGEKVDEFVEWVLRLDRQPDVSNLLEGT